MEDLDKIVRFSVEKNVLRGSLEIYSEIDLAPVFEKVESSSVKLEALDTMRDRINNAIVRAVVKLALSHFLDNSRKDKINYIDSYDGSVVSINAHLHITPYHTKNPIVIMHPLTEVGLRTCETVDLEKEE